MDWTRFNELVALSGSGKIGEAISGLKELAQATGDQEDKAGVMAILGACQRDADQLDETHRTLVQARSLANRDSWVHPRALFFDATIDVRRRKWKGALQKLEEILRCYPAFLDQTENRDLPELIGRYRGMALYKLGSLTEARALLESAPTAQHDRAGALYYLGRCCYDMGDLEAARDSLSQALTLDLDPDYQPVAHYVLGLTYHWKGQHARAVQEFEWCLGHDDRGLVQKCRVLTALVDALKALGMEREAEHYAKALRALPSR
jgi:tetratricopeptide (TPR) repeat protein